MIVSTSAPHRSGVLYQTFVVDTQDERADTIGNRAATLASSLHD